jgi:hypothetical protein
MHPGQPGANFGEKPEHCEPQAAGVSRELLRKHIEIRTERRGHYKTVRM